MRKQLQMVLAARRLYELRLTQVVHAPTPDHIRECETRLGRFLTMAEEMAAA